MKTLVKKYNKSVLNNDLLKVSELRIKFFKSDSWKRGERGFSFIGNKDLTFSIIGDGYFTDNTGTQNKGKTLTNIKSFVYVSNSDIEVSIISKEDLYAMEVDYNNCDKRVRSIDLSLLRYSPSLCIYDGFNTLNIGSIEDFANKKKLASIENTIFTKNGDIAALAGTTAITKLNIYPVFGNIDVLQNNSKLNKLAFGKSVLTGDLAKMPNSLIYFENWSRSNTEFSHFSWSERPSSANIIAIVGSPLIDNVDKMLQDQSNCKAAIPSGATEYYKQISVKGNRTSASDSAVAALQAKGYTISITPA